MNEYALDTNYLSHRSRMETIRDGLGEGVAALGKKHEDVVVVGADTIGSSRAKYFAETFPERTVQVGVAEQNLIGTTAGFASYGKVPYAFTYAVFLVGRAWEPIRTTLCYPRHHAVLVGSHAGIATGQDGPTHQMTEDIALMASLPHMTVLAPVDYEQAQKAVEASYDLDGPVYLRGVREATPVMTTGKTPFEIGKAQVFREGSDVTVLGHGYMLDRLLRIAEDMKDDVSLEVINVHTIKPLDVDTIVASVRKTGVAFVAEDHTIYGGLGSLVAQALLEHGVSASFKIHGINDMFAESGTAEDLWKKYQCDVSGMREVFTSFLSQNT